ncbi:hypothetical protein [Streptomyces himalayensis]|uniref:Uncharacterized protein n=1 Tax=Streptomyces himalayensis subsp. himalayensis TaxID=2756131 RepID=A0A7W0DLX9_9ACTN|nr:hypothetical protein [Streptomyces himalayensis]MBA2947543.1 hypothetical protein [Streptomyces himalayensis subsp. himalayensis]
MAQAAGWAEGQVLVLARGLVRVLVLARGLVRVLALDSVQDSGPGPALDPVRARAPGPGPGGAPD